jgi:hypothetical protein
VSLRDWVCCWRNRNYLKQRQRTLLHVVKCGILQTPPQKKLFCLSIHLLKCKDVRLTNSTELNHSWGAASCAANQEFPNILWNPKFYCRVHKSPPLVPVLNQINPVHINPSCLTKIHFNIVRPPTSWSSQWSLSFWLSHQYICIPLLPHSCYMPCPSRPPWLHHFNYTYRGVQVMELLIMQFSTTSWQFITLRSKYSPQTPSVYVPLLISETNFHIHEEPQSKL